MKIIKLLLLLFLLAGCASAQSASNSPAAPGLQVLEKSWRRDIRNPMLEEDPLRINRDQMELERAIRQNQRDNAVRASMGLPQQPPPTRAPSTTPREMPGPATVEYVYRAKVTNTGTKAIRKLVWEYVFFEPGTQKEVGRRRSESTVNIRPGKNTTLVARSLSPPTGTINAAQAGKKLKEQYSEQVVIQSIEYADGTSWRRTVD